jgi:hypothetical protein
VSIEVPLDELAAEVDRRGAGYLLTSTTEGRPHVMHVRFTVDDGELRVRIGRSASANIAAQPAVTMLWSPVDAASEDPAESYSLIADGTAVVEHGGDGPVAVVATTHAVFHRPAS